MQVYLGVTPREYRAAARYGRPLAHVAYRIGEGSSLLRHELLMNVRGGLLTVGDQDAPLVENPEALTRAVLRECGRRGYQGVLLDFEGPVRRDLTTFARTLAAGLGSVGPLYLPERYAPQVPEGIPLVCTAVSGGSFQQYLRDCARQYRGRFGLDVERLRMDFSLPAPSGTGTPLTAQALSRLMQAESPAVFFSPELCARYFTYRRQDVTHFVLFDDADTMARKLRAGDAMGLPAAFLMWPEASDLADRLFRRQGANGS